MKNIFLILSILISSIGISSLPSNCLVRNLDTIPHPIDIKSMLYKPASQYAGYLAFKPVKFVKLSMKTGINNTAARTEFVSDFIDKDKEIGIDALQVFRYDIRAKIYVNKSFRIVLRTQYLGSTGDSANANYYFVGILYRFK